MSSDARSALTGTGGDGVSSEEDGFFSGEMVQTVGIGAILLAIFSLLQTNAAAAILPDAFRWVQVFRNNNNLSREEKRVDVSAVLGSNILC